MMSGKAKWTLATGLRGVKRASQGRPIRQRASPPGRQCRKTPCQPSAMICWPDGGITPLIPSLEGRGRKLSRKGNAPALALPRVLFVADSNRLSGVLGSFFKVTARPADGNERIQDLEVQGGWYGEFARKLTLDRNDSLDVHGQPGAPGGHRDSLA